MIKLKKFFNDKLMSSEVILPTIFPDKTSQVWKVNGISGDEPHGNRFVVYWQFEKEEELIHVCSLLSILKELQLDYKLIIPYLPYGRQDKVISNTSTFNLNVLETILKGFIKEVYVFDQHSIKPGFFKQLTFINDFHTKCLMDCNDKMYCVVFPDEGAVKKYQEYPMPFFKKKRNQLTGEITGLEFSINEKRRKEMDCYEVIYIIDDLVDGGKTFIECGKVLKELFPKIELRLCVSHGIFSKGFDELNKYFSKVYYTDSLIKNKNYSYFNIESYINKGEL